MYPRTRENCTGRANSVDTRTIVQNFIKTLGKTFLPNVFFIKNKKKTLKKVCVRVFLSKKCSFIFDIFSNVRKFFSFLYGHLLWLTEISTFARDSLLTSRLPLDLTFQVLSLPRQQTVKRSWLKRFRIRFQGNSLRETYVRFARSPLLYYMMVLIIL